MCCGSSLCKDIMRRDKRYQRQQDEYDNLMTKIMDSLSLHNNLINFNATRVFCSPSYVALKMLAHSHGTHSLSMALGHASVPSE